MASGKAPAWQVRDKEWQNLFDNIERKMLATESTHQGKMARPFLLNVADGLIEFLKSRILRMHGDLVSPGELFADDAVVRPIAREARHETEIYVYVGRFLINKVLPNALAGNERKFSQVRFDNPMIIYRAKKSSYEIPLPD